MYRCMKQHHTYRYRLGWSTQHVNVEGCKDDCSRTGKERGVTQAMRMALKGVSIHFLARVLCNVCSLMKRLTVTAVTAKARPVTNAPLMACMYESNTSALCQLFGK